MEELASRHSAVCKRWLPLFFVTLGTLLDPLAFLQEPLLLIAGLAGILALKTAAAALALRLIGLSWTAALGMGVGLAQLGEFSFLVLAEGVGQGVIRGADYNRMLFIALGTLILTPPMLKFGLRWTGGMPDVLRLTGFETSNGPDVHVYLVAASDAMDSDTVKSSGHVELGKLKGNVGNQNYDVPEDVDLDKYRAVTIWCSRFGVNFGTAPLK